MAMKQYSHFADQETLMKAHLPWPQSPASDPLLQADVDIKENPQDLLAQIKETRDSLKEKGKMAITHLIYAALDHAAEGISHPIHTVKNGIEFARKKTLKEWLGDAKSVTLRVWAWAKRNPIKVSLMVVGLGYSAFKAKTMTAYMTDISKKYMTWSKNAPLPTRFLGFVALMSVRLIVSTLVPPTSPAFGIIITKATPNEQQWTAMLCFLLASALAGAWPYIFDKFLQLFTKKDFQFTMGAKSFADNYPLTCWSGPAMREAFHRVYNSGGGAMDEKRRLRKGKLGASFAVILGHVFPFMGAQTTIMQRFFLPHPIDTIVSQPFGMTEDLVSMALGQATSNPVEASGSLTALIVLFNFMRGAVFTGHHPHPEKVTDESAETEAPDLARRSTKDSEIWKSRGEDRDWVALAMAVINVLVGLAVGCLVAGDTIPLKTAFFVVVVQMCVQMLVVPILLDFACG